MPLKSQHKVKKQLQLIPLPIINVENEPKVFLFEYIQNFIIKFQINITFYFFIQ